MILFKVFLRVNNRNWRKKDLSQIFFTNSCCSKHVATEKIIADWNKNNFCFKFEIFEIKICAFPQFNIDSEFEKKYLNRILTVDEIKEVHGLILKQIEDSKLTIDSAIDLINKLGEKKP